MNSVSFSCEYGKLSEIKKLDNIKRIYLSIKLNPYEDTEMSQLLYLTMKI